MSVSASEVLSVFPLSRTLGMFHRIYGPACISDSTVYHWCIFHSTLFFPGTSVLDPYNLSFLAPPAALGTASVAHGKTSNGLCVCCERAREPLSLEPVGTTTIALSYPLVQVQ